ncbi:MAG: hypothetical protein PVJ49_15365 [Acidobacteriota bacterium]
MHARCEPRAGRAALPLLLVAVLASAACGGGAATDAARFAPRVNYLSADVPTLLQRANAWTAASLRAEGQLRMYWSGDEDSRHVDVRLFAAATGALYLRGSRSLAGEIFVLVSDGRDFHLTVPDHAAVYTGTSAAPAQPDPERPYFSLRPQHITEALLPEVLPTSNAADSWVSLQTYPDRYALVWMEMADGEARTRRKVWIERVALRVSQIEGFDNDGRIEFIADYSNYLGRGPAAYPGTIEVERVWEELTFRFDFDNADDVERNPQIPAQAFQFRPVPPGYRVLTIEQAMEEFRRGGGR